jgi:hypothetical protein
MHNAGVTGDVSKELFYKANYMSQLPYFADGSTYLKDRCSYKYFEFMKKVGKNHVYFRKNKGNSTILCYYGNRYRRAKRNCSHKIKDLYGV